MKFCCRLLFIASLFCLVPRLRSGPPELKRVDSILATVNGVPVSLLDVLLESRKQEIRLAMVYRGKELEDEVKRLRKTVVDEIIDRKLIYADFKNYNFKIPKQYIEDNLQSLAKAISDGSMKGLKQQAEKFGITLDELRAKAEEKVIVDVMTYEFCVRPVNITPRDTYEFYQSHLADFKQPAQVLLSVLLLRKNGKHKGKLDKVIKEIEKECKTGNASIFKTMVNLHSEGPDADKSGSLGWIEKDKLRPEFAEALKGKAAGSIVGPVDTDDGIYFIRIDDIKSAEGKTFADVKQQIHRRLEVKQREELYQKYIERLKKNAVVRYFF